LGLVHRPVVAHRPIVAHRRRFVVHGGRAGEMVALALVDELVVGHALLVHLGTLLAHLSLGTLVLGLGLGHLCLLLRHLRLAVAVGRLGAMPIGGTLATAFKLTLGL